MLAFLRALRLLALIAWMGGIAFFGAIAAPAIFSPEVLELTRGNTRIPGLIVSLSLTRLHWLGMVCGVVLIVSALLLARISRRNQPQAVVVSTLTAAMLLLTAYIAFHVMPLMEHDKQLVGGDFTNIPATSPEREDFDHLHQLSTKLESFALFCALGITLTIATEDLPSKA